MVEKRITLKQLHGRKITTVQTGNRFYCSNMKSQSQNNEPKLQTNVFEELGIRSI